MRNLVLGVVGDTSLHKKWISGVRPEFDLFLVYYGDYGQPYHNDATYYDFGKGTKFHIVDSMVKKHQDLFQYYDAILIPDDDLILNAISINKFFEIFHRYDLWIAQPAIMGWLSLPITAPCFDTLLRYVRCVEIMSPCFSRDAFVKCQPSFTENKTNWGIDWLWYKMLGEPKNRLAVIDEVVAIHTRPCFFGDTYWRNNNTHQIACQEMAELFQKHQIEDVYDIFGSIPKDYKTWSNQPSECKFFPNSLELQTILKKYLSSHSPL
jgi:hypothetical protein